MPSGKQLSFQFGEVSQALKFRVDGPFYSAALNLLRNGYVRKDGGVSNRAGFRHIAQSNFQDRLYLGKGSSPQVKIYGFEGGVGTSSNLTGQRYLVEQKAPETGGSPDVPSQRIRSMQVSLVTDDQLGMNTLGFISGGLSMAIPHDGYKYFGSDNLKGGRIVQYGQEVYICFGDGYLILFNITSTGNGSLLIGLEPTALITTGTPASGTITTTGNSPDLPVAYLITQELIDGTETPWLSASLTTGHPHAQRHSKFNVDLAKSNKVKQYNVYRSDGGENQSGAISHEEIIEGKGGHFSLVARVPAGGDNVSDTPSLEATRFTDFLTQAQFNIQPPLDKRLYGMNYGKTAQTSWATSTAYSVDDVITYGGGAWVTSTAYLTGQTVVESGINYICLVDHTSGTFATDLAAEKWGVYDANGYVCLEAHTSGSFAVDLGNNKWERTEDGYYPGSLQSTRQRQLSSARLIGHYQQRRVIIPASTDPALNVTGFNEGTVIVSKLGTPDMLDAPYTLNSIDAFEFSLPVGKRNVIVGMIDRLPRLLLFTERDAIIVQGGDQGILTPSTVNPQAIGEGCSRYIAPVSAGTRGYYINARHSKLMGIQFEGAGNEASVGIRDLSIFSKHFLKDKDVIGLEVIEGEEDIVYILLGDGTLVNVTVGADLVVTGWGKIIAADSGFIESITKLRRDDDATYGEMDTATGNDIPNKELQADALYASIIRDGVRNIEVLMNRNDEDEDKFFYCDAAKLFGKRDYPVADDDSYENARLNLTTATTWVAGETITITRVADSNDWHSDNAIRSDFPADAGWDYNSGAVFATGEIDFRLVFEYEVAGVLTQATFTPVTFISGTSISGTFDIDVPAHLQDATTLAASTMIKDQTRYRIGFNKVTGLDHLAEKDVTVFADGETRANPNNTTQYPTVMTVDSSGDLTFPSGVYYTHGVIGLPYDFEMETLNLDTSDERTFTDANKLINAVGIAVENTRGGYIGQTGSGDTDDDLTDMNRIDDARNVLSSEVTGNMNGHFEFNIPGGWEKTGRVLIKQVDPEPITVLSIYPKGMVSE